MTVTLSRRGLLRCCVPDTRLHVRDSRSSAVARRRVRDFRRSCAQGASSNGRAPDSERLAARSEQIESGSEHLGSEQLERLKTLAAPMHDKAKVSKGLAEYTILALCADEWLSLRTMAQLLVRDPDSLRNHYINPMLRDGRLLARAPGKPNHPGQAYKAKAR